MIIMLRQGNMTQHELWLMQQSLKRMSNSIDTRSTDFNDETEPRGGWRGSDDTKNLGEGACCPTMIF